MSGFEPAGAARPTPRAGSAPGVPLSTLPRDLPDYAAVAAAAARLAGHAHRTPVMRSRLADAMMGAELFFKCENFQRGGAFKFRGAYNALSQFNARQRERGVVAFSSGNHAQAIALAASLLDIPATIVMPHDSPAAKLAATRGYGAKIIFFDRYMEDREAIAAHIAEQTGATLIPSYDHFDIIAGQGTAVLELIEEAGPLDAIFVCLGGGGLLAGSSLVARERNPRGKIYGVQPEAADHGRRSLRSGTIVESTTPRTIADGAQVRHLGRLTFEIIRRDVTDILAVSDDALVDAMRFFATRMKMVVEPTGCLGLAGVMAMRDDLRDQRVGVVVSGGNVDLDLFCRLLAV